MDSLPQDVLDERLSLLSRRYQDQLKPYLEASSLPVLRSPADFVDELVREFEGGGHSGATLPWGKTHSQVRFQRGETSFWAGYNFSGKSLLTGQTMLDMRHAGERVLCCSFEMAPRKTLKRMCKQALGVSQPTRGAILGFIEWLAKDRGFLFLDHRGAISPKVALASLRYAAREEGSTQLFMDNLSQVVKGTTDYDAQKDFIVDACAVAKDVDQHVHIVHHLKKPDDGNEMQIPSRYSMHGASALSDLVDNVLIVWKNKKKMTLRSLGERVDEADPDALVVVDKQRNGDWSGRIALWFDPNTGIYRPEQRVGWKRDYPIEVGREPWE
jgi:twinkle protein